MRLSSFILPPPPPPFPPFPPGCAIIRPPRDGGIRYRGLTQEQVQRIWLLQSIEAHHSNQSHETAASLKISKQVTQK